MISPGVYWRAQKALGPKWLLARSILALLKKSGVLERRSPLERWSDLSLDRILKGGIPVRPDDYREWRMDHHSSRFLFHDSLKLHDFHCAGLTQSADLITHGQFPFFGYAIHIGSPPDWRRNPLTDAPSPDSHWSSIDESKLDDIKLWWELNRFSWVFYLARAYLRTHDESYPETFWVLVESWMAQNPPNRGVNWVCGQETAFRAMALCFGFYVFQRSGHTTAERVCRMLALMAAHASRIDAFHEYAQSQKNNHGISEGVGLWTIGLLFPELRRSARWKSRGKRIIEVETRRQLYPDGSYIQHSTNYHRLLLQDLAWALRLAACNSEHFEPDILRHFRKATQFLYSLVDPYSGWAPNYGANDGALVLPLSDCSFPDMRPVLQACYFLAEKKRLYPPGPWDEEMILMNGEAAERAAVQATVPSATALTAEWGGYYTIRNHSSWAMLRCANYKDRPSHADQLHLDLWWQGENVLCDSGSYSYNARPPFDHGYASTRYHNTVTVGGHDQMTRVSRFLWSDWARGSVRPRKRWNGFESLQCEHDGYSKLGVIHRRTIASVEDGVWVVVDDLSGHGHQVVRLHWQTPDVPYARNGSGAVDLTFNSGTMQIRVFCNAPFQFDTVRAGQRIEGDVSESIDPASGWVSRLYGRKEPSLSFSYEADSGLPVRFITIVALGAHSDVRVDPSLRLIEAGRTRLHLSDAGGSEVISDIQWRR